MLSTYFAQYYNGYDMMDGGGAGWGLLIMLFWVVLILIVVLLLRGGHRHVHGTANQGDTLTIAKNRYAKGEINKEEFEQLKKDLLSK